jgi:cell wall-associated NlpC family hydrolase
MLTLFKHIKYSLSYLTLAALLLFFLAGCGTISYTQNHQQRSRPVEKRRALSISDRSKLADIAQEALGQPNLTVGNKSFRNDCSGTIRAIFAKAGLRLGGIIKNRQENDVKAIYRYIQRYGKISKDHPGIGDLVFFHNTYDRSRNGRMNDALTHVGIVEKIDGSTIHFIHHLGQAIIRSSMNLSMPHETYHPRTKKRINHVLRRAQGAYRAYTSAELFAGFGRL